MSDLREAAEAPKDYLGVSEDAPEAPGQTRNSSTEFAAGFISGATSLAPVTEWHVRLDYPLPHGNGNVSHFLTVAQARELAAALIRGADHYEAETARLAEQVAA